MKSKKLLTLLNRICRSDNHEINDDIVNLSVKLSGVIFGGTGDSGCTSNVACVNNDCSGFGTTKINVQCTNNTCHTAFMENHSCTNNNCLT